MKCLSAANKGWRIATSAACTRRNEGCSIWVVQSRHLIASQPEDRGAFFDPSEDKIYRHPTFYTIPDGIKNM